MLRVPSRYLAATASAYPAGALSLCPAVRPGGWRFSVEKPMPRYVLAYFGSGNRPQKDVDKIQQMDGLVFVSVNTENVLVVDAPPQVKQSVNKMRDWMASEEVAQPAPGPLRP